MAILDGDIHLQYFLFSFSEEQNVVPSLTPQKKNKFLWEPGHRKGEFTEHNQVGILEEKKNP